MEGYILKQEHDEFAHRLDDENRRQNHRIGALEETVCQINALTVSVEKMEVTMENMLEEQKKQGERLNSLEKEPADSYKQIKISIIIAFFSAAAGFIAKTLITIL